MSIRLGYLDGAHGQVHYRTLGEGPLLVLLHWAPSNGRQYELLMPHFAARGFRVLALDMPGYGRSHKATADWSCAQIAAEIAIALDHLADRNTAAYAVGGHLSAAVVAELAITTPQRWRRVVLDGSPTLTAEQMAKLMQSFAGLSPAISATGSHKTFVWDMTERFLHEWHPDYEANAANFATHYEYMADYLQIGSQAIAAFVDPKAPKGGLATYRAFERWPLIPVPVLALTAERDALRLGHAAALSLLKHAQQHEFPGAHPLLVPSRAQEYVKVIADFLQQ
jgi:pimeloyl-ACP methyl ester carboxylesterase